MARGGLRTDGVKVTYQSVVLEHLADVQDYENLVTDQALEDVRQMSYLEKQAAYIKHHWDLMRLCATKRNKADIKWRKQNASFMIWAEGNGLLEPGQEVALDRAASDNLILKEQISNHGFWNSRVQFHAAIIATEKNARDLLGIPYPGAELAERSNDPRLNGVGSHWDISPTGGSADPTRQRGFVPRQSVPSDGGWGGR